MFCLDIVTDVEMFIERCCLTSPFAPPIDFNRFEQLIDERLLLSHRFAP